MTTGTQSSCHGHRQLSWLSKSVQVVSWRKWRKWTERDGVVGFGLAIEIEQRHCLCGCISFEILYIEFLIVKTMWGSLHYKKIIEENGWMKVASC